MRIEEVQGSLRVVTKTSRSAVSSFRQGSITFDTIQRTVTIARFDPLSLPDGFVVVPDRELVLELQVDGKDEIRRRLVVPSPMTDNTHLLKVTGQARSRRNRKEDGWGMLTYKFRAYLTHEGVDCDPFPEDLKASLDRQRSLWNRLAIYLRAVRLACSNESPEQNHEFIEKVIFAAIKKFNESLVRGIESTSSYSSRWHSDCGFENKPTSNLRYQCAGCGAPVDQDVNCSP
jgi:hypothetical protein